MYVIQPHQSICLKLGNSLYFGRTRATHISQSETNWKKIWKINNTLIDSGDWNQGPPHPAPIIKTIGAPRSSGGGV